MSAAETRGRQSQQRTQAAQHVPLGIRKRLALLLRDALCNLFLLFVPDVSFGTASIAACKSCAASYRAYHVVPDQQLQIQHDFLAREDRRVLPLGVRVLRGLGGQLQLLRGGFGHQRDNVLRGLSRFVPSV